MNAENKPRYRTLRNKLGFGLAIAWVVLGYLYLDARHSAALAEIRNCEALKGTEYLACEAKGTVDQGGSAIGFIFKFVGILFSAPFAFVIGHYAARGMIERDESNALAAMNAAAIARQREDEQERAARIAQSEAAASTTKLAIDRGQFIHKLGSANDLLDLLGHETDSKRLVLIKQNLANELRELVAKHTVADLAHLIRSDESIRILLPETLDRIVANKDLLSDAARVLRVANERASVLS